MRPRRHNKLIGFVSHVIRDAFATLDIFDRIFCCGLAVGSSRVGSLCVGILGRLVTFRSKGKAPRNNTILEEKTIA